MTDEEEAKIDDLDDGRTVADGETVTENELRRDLKPHQVFMFAIACSIGTGLVIGSGTALAKGGPGSAFIAYILVATALFAVMMSMGEMAAFLPMDKGFSGYATRMVGPAFGYGLRLLFLPMLTF